MREKPINKGLQQFHRSVARIWELLRRVHFELLIIGSQVRALVRPPSFSSTYNTTHQNGPFGWEASWEFLFAIRARPPCHLLKEWRDGCAVPQRLPRIPTAWSALSRESLGGRGTPSPGIG